MYRVNSYKPINNNNSSSSSSCCGGGDIDNGIKPVR
jgi:hypothetical protein